MNSLPREFLTRLKSCRTLPTIPGVALRLIELCRSEDVSVAEVAQLLQQDPALSAKLLRYANSASIGVRSPVTTISRAAVLLGLLTLQTVALSFSLVTSLQRESVGGFDHKRYWRRSLFCASASQAIGSVLSLRDSESLFIVGLLQDVGMLVMAHAMGPDYTNIAKDAGPMHEDLMEVERRAFGFDHASVTAWMAGEWKLPAMFVEASEASHGAVVGRVPDDDSDPSGFVPQVVALASHVADIFCAPDVAHASTRAELAARLSLSMSRETFTEVLERTIKLAANGAMLLELDLRSGPDVTKILEDARESLLELTMRSSMERQALESVAQRDSLTGLWNRAHLDRTLDGRFAEAVQSRRPLTVAFCDIDFFKRVNDTYGHLAGDEVLKMVASMLSGTLGETDLVARYGGEEFVVVMPGASAPDAQCAFALICESIAGAKVTLDNGQVVRVTISIGLATCGSPAFPNVASLLRAADGALYAAKGGGRNRVCQA